MDWQIRIALIIVGIGIISFIIFDYNRRKKSQIQKQRLIDQMRESAGQVDGMGFDITGVGSARKTSEQSANPVVSSETKNSSLVEEEISVSDPTYSNPQLSESSKIETPLPDELLKTDEPLPTKARSKTSPTEQLGFDDLTESDHENNNTDPDLVFSLVLKANEDAAFKGNDFMPIFLSQGLRHGDMGIFHRHQGVKSSSVLYSVANAINPGTFDIQNIENFETPAFAFFMTVPGPTDPMMAFEGMVKTIKLLKQELGGQILDQSKSVFTEQTYQHQRDLLQNYLTKASIRS